MNNPLDMLKMIRNPKQYALNMAKQMNNPILSNMIQLAEQGKTKEVEQIARNIFKEKGIDYDKDISPMIKK